MVESRSPKPLVLGSSPSAPAINPGKKVLRIFYFGRGTDSTPVFLRKTGFSDGENEANRLARGVKPRATLKAVFGRVARNAPPGRFVLAYLAPLPCCVVKIDPHEKTRENGRFREISPVFSSLLFFGKIPIHFAIFSDRKDLNPRKRDFLKKAKPN